MINNNKILTVSYGTFSCTLEGFDDSFGTMKAIAEYFRDLSADDRYFGAEPAQPDAQMLARIAQREISRHVEAREDDGRIVLSAQDTPEAAALVASVVVDDVADAVADAAVAKAADEAPHTPAPTQAHVAPEPTQADEAQAVADIADMEAEDAQEAEAEAVQEPVADIEDIVEEVAEDAAQDLPTPDVTDAKAPEADGEERDIVPSLPDADVEAFFADSTPETDEEFTAVEDNAKEDDAPEEDRIKADSIADKLKRIRAVVSQQSSGDAEPDYSEDQHADAAAAQPEPVMAAATQIELEDDLADEDLLDEDVESDVLADTLRDLEEALDADDEHETPVVADPAAQNEEDDIAAILNRLEQDSADDAPVSLEDIAVDDIDDDDMDDSILAAMDSLVAAPDADDLDDISEDNLFDADESTAPEDTPISETDVVPARPRTRVLKVKRATLDAAIQAGKLEEYEDDSADLDEADLARTPLANASTLSDEAEEELARELAALEADMEAEDALEIEPAAADPIVEEEASAATRAEIQGKADADMSRLMQETDSQMDEPESATRRDAFAHLRAAVAAKKADEAVGGGLGEEESDEAYRDDLANVVRPRRPVAGERTRTERPAEQRPAPLKLVAEQRIDIDEARSAAPVRPRRVAAVAAAPAPSASDEAASFADFAADAGADKLPDLLEAAAAYLSFVEGHEQFSRPQLMTKVRQVEKENFTREDSLRSFGKLLREGKIEKLKGGRFQASEQIGFKPESRAAG